MEELQAQLTSDLLHLYNKIVKEVKVNKRPYVPARFLQMVTKSGGLETVRDLLIKSVPPHEGLKTLYVAGRLDLTVEAFVLKNDKYNVLLTTEMLENAKKQLKDLGYKF